jgi:hypothetical protein
VKDDRQPSGMYHRVVLLKQIEVSEVRTDSIIRAMMEVRTSEASATSTRPHDAISSQKAVIFMPPPREPETLQTEVSRDYLVSVQIISY